MLYKSFRLYLLLILCASFGGTFAQNHYLEWAVSEGGSSSDFSFCVTSDNDANVYTIGIFQGTVDFDPGPGTNFFTSNGSSDIFIQKFYRVR